MSFLPFSIRKMRFFRKRDKKKGTLYLEVGGGGGGGGKDGRGNPTGAVNGRRHNGNNHTYENDRAAGRGQMHASSSASSCLMARLPDAVFERIFTFVCPHTDDKTYETCEQSSIDDACMLCDLRDLAHCVAVCRQWRKPALKRLYYSIRIDAVHYCEREIYLSEKRKRRSFFDRNGLPEDPAQVRLRLLCRTLREDPTRLGALVNYFKTPYMLRESCQADLARIIAVLPNLRYVDLPEGLFADDPAHLTLRLEVQARCQQLRKMTYMAGAERSLEALAGGVWSNLEVLELVRVQAEPAMLRHVLGSLQNLHALKVSETRAFVDEILFQNERALPFPALEELILKDVPGVTAEGLKQHLASPGARARLKTLSLTNTGVGAWDLQGVLERATSLAHLTVVAAVASSLPTAAGTHDIPPLSSASLRTLNWEITAAASAGPFASGVTASYYNYLSGSLLSGGLPGLNAVYVRDANFPDSLLGLPPPAPAFAEGRFAPRPSTSGSTTPYSGGFNSPMSGGFGSPASPRSFLSPGGNGGLPPPLNGSHLGGASSPQNPFQDAPQPPQKPWAAGHNPRFSSNNPFAALIPTQQIQTLEVFTKGDDELDWSFVKVSSDSLGGAGGFDGIGHRRAGSFSSLTPERPHSSYGLSSDGAAAWGATAGARRSVFMGNGAGGFLAVPDASSTPAGNGGGPLRERRGSSNQRHSAVGGDSEWPMAAPLSEKKRERMDLWR